MRRDIIARDDQVGLSRLLAGFAWKYRSKTDPAAIDIELDGLRLQWNATEVDWVSSPGSVEQVGSIHTIQGYDLNYAGVIVGRDLRLDQTSGRIVFDRNQYFDPRGTTNNRMLSCDPALRVLTSSGCCCGSRSRSSQPSSTTSTRRSPPDPFEADAQLALTV